MAEAPVFLYTTAGCHLCEQAEALLRELLGASFGELTRVDVSDSDELVARYGLRIPVLAGTAADGAGLELDWPFTSEALLHFFGRIEP